MREESPRDESPRAASRWEVEPRLTGRRIGGRYELGALRAAGGMAWLYEATDEQLGRVVAVKLLRPELGRDPLFAARFRQEAHAAASLTHPNVVTIHDYGEDPDTGLAFIVMELISGSDLAARLAAAGPLPVDLAVSIAGRVASALALAHQHGIVHRDVKPGNILLADDGTVKVVDFGIARALSDASLTLTGTTLGSVHYISPESASGEPVSPASDIYSLGIVLFEMLTGRRPFEGENAMGIALRRLRERPPHPRSVDPDIPRDLDAIVMRALERNPGRRFHSADEFAAALAAFERSRSAAAGAGGIVSAPVEAPAVGTVYGRAEAHRSTHRPLAPARPARARTEAETAEATVPVRSPGPSRATSGEREADRRRVPVAVIALAVLVLLASAGLGALRAVGVVGGDASPTLSAQGTPPLTGGGVEPSPTPTVAPTLRPTPRPTPSAEPTPPPTPQPTPEPTAAPTPAPTAAPTPRPTAQPTPRPATPRPATPPPTEAPVAAAPDNQPARTVVTWYALVEAHRFDDAAALWTSSMRERYPPDEYIDGRFAPTTAIRVNSARTIAYNGSAGTATVYVDLTEWRENGDVRRWIGDWDLVLTSGGWRLNDPDF